MQLQVSSSYQPNEDEVWVDFRSTLDDLTTVTVADTVELKLMIESSDPIGAVSYIPISHVQVDSSYVQPDRNYEVIFRNPLRKMDLWVQVSAVYGSTTYQKLVLVGEANSSHNSIDLPDNAIFTQDVLTEMLTGGGNGNTLPNENVVVLAPELRDYVQLYDFTTPHPIEDYDGLVYMGGGNRLLIQNQNNQFEIQAVDQAPWSLNGFLFLEPPAQNLIPNSFFLNTTNSSNLATGVLPTGFTVYGVGSIVQSSVQFNYQVSAAAKIWVARFTQGPGFSYVTKQAKIQLSAPVPVTSGTDYTFSTYAQVTILTSDTVVSSLILSLQWMNGSTPLTPTNVTLDPRNFSDMSIAALTGIAPVGATSVQPTLLLGSIDAGDDVQLSLLGPQLETGMYPTSRTDGARLQDEVVIDGYNAMNQKIRLEMIAGFPSGLTDQQIVQGPIDIFFYASGMMEARIWGIAGVTTPFAFSAGDLIDLTVSHQAGKTLAVYRDGQLLADTPLPNFTTPVGPLTILGVGVELMKLSVFSRRGD